MKTKETNACQDRKSNFFWGALMIAGVVLLVSAVSHSRNNEKAGSFGPGPEHFQVHLRDKMDSVLDRLDATKEQRERSASIVADLSEYADHFEAARKDLSARLVEILSQKEIDVVPFAEIRLEMLELTDEASAKLFDAIYDLSELLTPEQRVKLLEFVREHS
jgi:Spy/CpxP family protein refolding chaperone